MAPAFRAVDGFNPLSTRIPIARANGVTSAVLLPRGGVLAGTGYAVSLSGSLNELPDVKKPVVMSADFGGGGAELLGGARGGEWLRLRSAFADARWYAKNRSAVEQNRARALSLPPAQLEALIPVVEGKLPLLVWVHRASDVLAVLRFAQEEKVKVIIAGASEAWLVADALKAANVPVLLVPSEQVPHSFDQLHARDDAATVLEKAGVTVVVISGDAMRRRLRQEAGIAVAYGFPRAKAVEAITGRPAKVLGLSEVGVVKAGLRGDVVLWSGDPLELSTVAEKVFIGGVEQSLVTRETKLVERYLERVPAKK